MNELLGNEAVQAALITLIVVGLNALVAWLKAKTKGSLIEANWCYLQPVVAAFIASVREALRDPGTGSQAYARLVDGALVRFADEYALYEGRQPTEAEIAAARAELTAALKRVLGG